MRFEDGTPALVVSPRGAGKIALWTTTLDCDWNDLALRPGYLPLVQSLMKVLSKRSGAGLPERIVPGHTAIIARQSESSRLVVSRLKSNGHQQQVQVIDAPASDATQWEVQGLLEPGLYTVEEQGAGTTWSRTTVLVQAPAAESDLSTLTTPSPPEPRQPGWALADRPKVPAWSFALSLLFVLLLFEGLLLMRNRQRT